MMPKIPQHNTPRGTWCRFSGCDSTSGICRACEPDEAPRPEPRRAESGLCCTVYDIQCLCAPGCRCRCCPACPKPGHNY